MLPIGEYVACVFVKLTWTLGRKVGHAEKLYVPITAPNTLCANNAYTSRNGRLFNLKDSIPTFLQDMMIDYQFILLTIFNIIIRYRVMPLFSSEYVKMQYKLDKEQTWSDIFPNKWLIKECIDYYSVILCYCHVYVFKEHVNKQRSFVIHCFLV